MEQGNSATESPSGSSTDSSDSTQLEIATKRLIKSLLAAEDTEKPNAPPSVPNAAGASNIATNRLAVDVPEQGVVGTSEKVVQSLTVKPKVPQGFQVLSSGEKVPPGSEVTEQTPLSTTLMDALTQLYDTNPAQFQQIAEQIKLTNVYGQGVTTESIMKRPDASNVNPNLPEVNAFDVLRVDVNSIPDVGVAKEISQDAVRTAKSAVKRSALLSPTARSRSALTTARKRLRIAAQHGQKAAIKSPTVKAKTPAKKHATGMQNCEALSQKSDDDTNKSSIEDNEKKSAKQGVRNESEMNTGNNGDKRKTQKNSNTPNSTSCPNTPATASTLERRRPNSAPLTVNTTLANDAAMQRQTFANPEPSQQIHMWQRDYSLGTYQQLNQDPSLMGMPGNSEHVWNDESKQLLPTSIRLIHIYCIHRYGTTEHYEFSYTTNAAGPLPHGISVLWSADNALWCPLYAEYSSTKCYKFSRSSTSDVYAEYGWEVQPMANANGPHEPICS